MFAEIVQTAIKTKAQLDLDDRLLHYLFLAIGLTIGGVLKEGIQWVSKKIWKATLHKVEMTATDIKDFHEWKKTRGKTS